MWMASALLPPPGLRFSTIVAVASAASFGVAYLLMSRLASQGEDCATAAALPLALGIGLGVVGLLVVAVRQNRWRGAGWRRLAPWLVVNGALLAPSVLWWV